MIWRLGHVEITVDDLDRAKEFYVDLLGFEIQQRDAERLYLRAAWEFDAWSLCLRHDEGKGLGHVAFRVSDNESLDDLEQLHQRLGLATERVPAGTEPNQGPALRTVTPDGHAIEFYHLFDEIPVSDGPDVRLPMRRTNGSHGVPPQRLDHLNLRCPNTPEALEYWSGALGFSQSELWLEPDGSVRTAWVRRTLGTHDIALGPGAAALHHFAYRLADESAVIRAADLMGDAGLEGEIDYGPSRHGATNAMCLYLFDPAGNRIELYAGDYERDLDRPAIRWSAEAYARHGHSWWGLPPGDGFRKLTSPLRAGRWPGVGATASAASGGEGNGPGGLGD